jgi:hypothetical protein
VGGFWYLYFAFAGVACLIKGKFPPPPPRTPMRVAMDTDIPTDVQTESGRVRPSSDISE